PAVSVELTSFVLADDCGGTPPARAPSTPAAPPAITAPAAATEVTPHQARADVLGVVVARRRCEQTSMQLVITSAADTTLHVKSVEVFDDAGTSIGVLAASRPTRWTTASSTYEAWDERVSAGTPVAASYVLAQPSWAAVDDAHDHTYTVKAIVTVGGVDQPVQRTITVTAPAHLPAPVPT
ncbi:MAG: hypothetical protein NT062_12610, partial [Proteobacteria bacterium]|nr:hypothetical protein [Pseudomonadota bacterium]